MGRPAKYHTREERLIARRAQRARRESEPGYDILLFHLPEGFRLRVARAKEVRRAQGRRAWQKKRNLALLNKGPPNIPEAVREQALKEISSLEYSRMYNQFLQGRDTLGFEEVDIEEEDFEAMMGAPPYSNLIASLSGFSEKLPVITAALHGMLVRKHIAHCDDLLARARSLSQLHIYNGLNAQYHELIVKFNETTICARDSSERGDIAAVAMATLNNKWAAKQIVDTVEGMEALREGCDKFIRTILERKWQLGSGRHEECSGYSTIS